jgi:hypothetical protein
MDQIKLTDQEIQQILDLRTKYANIAAQLGQLKIEQILVNKELNRLTDLENQFTKEYNQIQLEEEQFANVITEKYGTGDINLDTGFFIPTLTTV